MSYRYLNSTERQLDLSRVRRYEDALSMRTEEEMRTELDQLRSQHTHTENWIEALEAKLRLIENGADE